MPKKLPMDKVQNIIGEEATNKLLQEAQGMIIYVTDTDRASKEARDAAIINIYYGSHTLTYDDIGKMYGISGERVRQIVNKKRH